MNFLKLSILFILLIASPKGSSAQSALLPLIGLAGVPADTDSTCYIPMFNGSFNSSGIQEGDSASDFRLYDLTGDSVQLSAILSSGKPALIIAGSYTCPVFRNKVSSINNVVSLYGNQLEVLVVYTLEAHPDVDTSVYFGYVNTGAANISAGILYRQPITYGQRKDVVTDMLSAISINAPVYIDGPCNTWWNHYGPAPNNAYLIDTTGNVFAKHGWYDKFPDHIICDIDSLLGNPVNCSGTGSNGSFTFNLLTNDTIYGTPGSTITLSGELVNNSSGDVVVEIYRLINNLPFGWASSLCADVCYPTTTDTAAIVLPAGSVQSFHFYFYTNNSVDTARARVGFRNQGSPNNQFARNLFGITESALSAPVTDGEATISLFPNPANDHVYVKGYKQEAGVNEWLLSDLTGRIIKRIKIECAVGSVTTKIYLSDLSPGVYLLQPIGRDGIRSSSPLVISR